MPKPFIPDLLTSKNAPELYKVAAASSSSCFVNTAKSLIPYLLKALLGLCPPNLITLPIELSVFSSLSIPTGATIDGIEIDIEGAGNPGLANIPQMKVYNGSWSSGIAFVSQFSKGGATFSPGWGSATQLWGLSWNATTAAAIQIQIDSSTFDSGGYFWDWLKVKITYTVTTTYPSDDNAIIKNGLINLKNGITVIK